MRFRFAGARFLGALFCCIASVSCISMPEVKQTEPVIFDLGE